MLKDYQLVSEYINTLEQSKRDLKNIKDENNTIKQDTTKCLVNTIESLTIIIQQILIDERDHFSDGK